VIDIDIMSWTTMSERFEFSVIRFTIVIPAERSESRDPLRRRPDGSRLGAMQEHRLAGMTNWGCLGQKKKTMLLL
jgi:hypothetical protein